MTDAQGTRAAPKFCTVKQVAERLNVSPRSVMRWIECGELVAHKFGGAVRVSDADLRAFIAARRVIRDGGKLS